ncbi:MAG TPA: hypothetical protein PKH65_04915 [Bacteroidia bacterium]|nr:hypothetical protein [Bacteroidia bacterium]HNT80003.1 hypothetical protein [Bacteroidia bacterium]
MTVRKCLYALISLAMLHLSCKKEEISFSGIPEIKLISVSPTLIKEFSDSIVFRIEYTDGDGNLGVNDPNIDNLFLVDNRIPLTYSFRIQQLSPTGSNISIKGDIVLTLNNTVITDSSSSQIVSYSIYVKDQSGNTSNTVTTPQLTVVK